MPMSYVGTFWQFQELNWVSCFLMVEKSTAVNQSCVTEKLSDVTTERMQLFWAHPSGQRVLLLLGTLTSSLSRLERSGVAS